MIISTRMIENHYSISLGYKIYFIFYYTVCVCTIHRMLRRRRLHVVQAWGKEKEMKEATCVCVDALNENIFSLILILSKPVSQLFFSFYSFAYTQTHTHMLFSLLSSSRALHFRGLVEKLSKEEKKAKLHLFDVMKKNRRVLGVIIIRFFFSTDS